MFNSETFAARQDEAEQIGGLTIPELLARWHEKNCRRPNETEEEIAAAIDIQTAVEDEMIDRVARTPAEIRDKAALMMALICVETVGRQCDFPQDVPEDIPLDASRLLAASLAADLSDQARATVTAAAVSQTCLSEPIETAPIGGEDYFPSRTPGDEPLDVVLLWQPAHGRRHGRWRLGFWGGARQSGWYDDDMGLMEPQPTRWHPLPAKPSM